jgi:hypothetical protein
MSDMAFRGLAATDPADVLNKQHSVTADLRAGSRRRGNAGSTGGCNGHLPTHLAGRQREWVQGDQHRVRDRRRGSLEIAERQIGNEEISIDLWDGPRPVGRVGSSDL